MMADQQQEQVSTEGSVESPAEEHDLSSVEHQQGLPTEEEWKAIEDRLKSLSSGKRRETLLKMNQILDDDRSSHISLQDVAERRTLTFEPSTRKLRVFSASSKPNNGEVDYKRWRRAAVRVAEDDELSEAHKRRVILQSLQGDAEDAIDLNRDGSVKEILAILDKLYGSVADGNDLLASFYQQYQQSGQTASQYLNQLYVLLGDIIKSGCVNRNKLPKTLLDQFIRGISDEELLYKLRLEEKLQSPPDFPDLLKLVRQEETRRQERRARHKRHVKSYVTTTTDYEETVKQELASPDDTGPLQQRITELESQVKSMVRTARPPRMVFCYRCGEDDHLATDCGNEPNKVLVEQKIKKRKMTFQKNW